MNITNKILELHAKGLTNQEIHNNIGGNKRSINTILNRHRLKSNRYRILTDTHTLEQLILGSILGDGYLGKTNNNRTSRLHFGHSEKQLDYLHHKKDWLSKYELDGKITKYTQFSERYKNGFTTSYYLNSKTHPIFTEYRNLFYKDNIKIIPEGSLKNLSDLGLAIWYMDDGHICKRSYQINTMCFSENEVNYLKQVLKSNFDIDATSDVNNVIYIRTSSKENFENRIKPFVMDSMKYKLRVLNKSGELRESPAADNPEPSQT